MSDTSKPRTGQRMFDKLAASVSVPPNLDPAPAPDVEAELRRGEAKVLDTIQSRDYVAFQVMPARSALLRPRLFFVPREGMLQWIANADLWRIRAPRDGRSVGLVYHSALVIVEGAGLLVAAIAVNANTCLFLQEYNPEFHRQPEPGSPVITRMKFYDPAGEKADKDKLQH